jgi:TolB protein
MDGKFQGYREAIMTNRLPRALLALLSFTAAAPAFAQGATIIAVPPLTPHGNAPEAASAAWQASQLIASDLRSTGDVVPLDPSQKDFYAYPEVTAPNFMKWRSTGAKALITGFVEGRSDGRLTFGCYIYDVASGREVGRKGFVVPAAEWRRAAHKCADIAYAGVTGAPAGMFDTRIAYVAESGVGDNKVKRIAVMDSDGLNQTYVTAPDGFAVTPRMSPKGNRVAYVSLAGGAPKVIVADLASGEQRPLVASDSASFAPRFSPDGRRIVFSLVVAGNSEIYVVPAGGGLAQRLTHSAGVDTDPSFSPDGSKILFESDRSGSQQLYVMNADGGRVHRVSFGGGWYAAPEWSPDGNHVAFTRRASDGLRIGIMGVDGSDEHILTSGPADEGPSWAPSGTELVFQRRDGTGQNGIYMVPIAGGQERKLVLPQGGSDPDWSGVLD